MVNEKQGKVYKPTPVYNRKGLRSALRGAVIQKLGNHNVSRTMAHNFKKLRKAQVNE